jgi:hypothetical protein
VRLTLHVPGIEFETDPLGATEHLFNGAIAGAEAETIERVDRLSQALTAAGIVHRLELYSGRSMIAYRHFGWGDG